MRRRAFLVLALVVAVAAGAAPAAQTPDLDAQAQRIFTSVMSPYCPGLLLADCPSPAAFDLRREIRARLEAGESAADIEQSLYVKFGDAIRAVPEPGGWGLILWAAPALVFLLSAGLLMWFLHRAGSGDAAATAPPEPIDPESAERLERALDEVP
jgi:cytochrome c-type biogenesis protein CcmH